MQVIDFIFVAAYFIVVLILGYISSRKETVEGYLIADRKLGAFNSATSIISSKIGGGLLLAFTAYIYAFGASAFTFFIGAVFGYIIFYFFARNLKKDADKNHFYTITDYLAFKYGASGTLWFSLALLLANVLNFGMQVIGGGKIIEKIIGIPYLWAITLMLAITLTYMVLGGFRAVVFTDVFQCGVLVVLFLSISAIFSSKGFEFSQISFGSMSPVLIISFFLAGIALPFCSIELWQRVYATRDQKALKNALILAMVLYSLVGAMLTFMALAVKQLLPSVDPDLALLEGFVNFLPPGLLGLGVIALMAVIMSSADTWMFNCASIFLQDILKIKEHIRKYYSVSFFAIGILGIILALVFKSVVYLTSLYAIIYMLLGFLVLFSWIFKFKKEYMNLTYPLLAGMMIFLLFIFGVKVELVALGLILVPIIYFISIFIYKIKMLRS